VLEKAQAAEIVDLIDLRRLPICCACHLELAFALREGRPNRALTGIVTRIAFSVWAEIETELLAQLRRAQMRGATWAAEARADLEERGPRSWVVRELVTRVARGMADEMAERDRQRPFTSLSRRASAARTTSKEVHPAADLD
jgi:hypothetical protein